MINKLTKEQEDAIQIYRDKWLARGLSCENLQGQEQRNLIEKLYEKNNYKKPYVWFCSSPLMMQIIANIIKDSNISQNIRENIKQNIWQNIRQNIDQNIEQNIWQNIEQNIGQDIWQNIRRNIDQNIGQNIWQNIDQNIDQNIWQNIGQNIEQNIWQNIRQNIGQNIRRNIDQNIEQNIWQNIRQNIDQNIEQNIGQNIGQNIWQNIDQNIRENIEQNIRRNIERNKMIYCDTWYAQHNVNWVAYYDYFHNVFGMMTKDEEYYQIFLDLTKLHWFVPLENICIVSQKPIYVKRKGIILHCEDGMSVEYRDGYGLYSLNGIAVAREIVMTPANKLDPKLILKEKNADIRREIIRKIGVKKVVEELGAKVINKEGNYELLILDIGDGRKRPYLKMKNPSIDTYHIEGVHPDCDTVEKALNYRNGTSEAPIVLT